MEASDLLHRSIAEPLRPPAGLRVLLLIARRGATEALRDRMTLLLSLFFTLVFPIFLVLTTILPMARGNDDAALTTVLGVYLLIIGLMPSSASVGIASGQFAGEKEQGNLTPLLASPASNLAIFGGKVVGSIVPAMIFSIVAELTYLLSVILLTGSDTLRLLSAGIAIPTVALVPVTSLFAATVASLISSRVRTFNTAQQVSGLVLFPLWGGIIGLGYKLQDWGSLAVIGMVVALFAIDVALAAVAAATWRREEVLAKL